MVSSLTNHCEQPFDFLSCIHSSFMNSTYYITSKVKGATQLFFHTASSFQDEEAMYRLQAILLSQSPKIKEYLELSKDAHSVAGQVMCRLFLEHIYGATLKEITNKEIRKLKLKIHPDKNLSIESTEMFQLHQRFWDGVKGDGYNTTWFHYTLYGWWYRRRIRSGTQLDLSV